MLCNRTRKGGAMALVGLKRAAELTGKNQSTIHRAMKSGRVSFSFSDTQERLIDTSELDRVFPIRLDGDTLRKDAPEPQSNDVQLIELRAQLQIEQVKAVMLEERLKVLEEIKADLREDRDRWRAQAEHATRLLTDQRQKQEPAPEPKKGFWHRFFFG